MDLINVTIVLMVILFLLLGSGLWVAVSLLAVALFAMLVFVDSPAGLVLATTSWGASATWTLTALPLFIWMGEILFRTRLAQDMFTGLAPWVQRLPGRLLHVNVIGCGIFAAVSEPPLRNGRRSRLASAARVYRTTAGSGVPKVGAPVAIDIELANDPRITGEPGRTSWVKAIPASASASVWAATPALVTGAIAPARMNGVMIDAWLASA